MAQHWFGVDQSDDVGALPTGWTLIGDVDRFSVQELDGQKYIEILRGSWKGVYPNAAITRSGVTEVVMLGRIKRLSDFDRIGGAALIASNTPTGYVSGARGTGPSTPTTQHILQINGASSDSQRATGTTQLAQETDIYLSLRLNGSQLESRYWLPGNSRPATAQLTTTDTTYSTGHLGVLSRNPDAVWVRGLGIGTDGDPAPTGPVGPGASRRTMPLLLTPW